MERIFGSRIFIAFLSLVFIGSFSTSIESGLAEESDGQAESDDTPVEMVQEVHDSEQELETLIEYYRKLQEKYPEAEPPLLKPWQLKLLKAAAEGAISTAGVSLYQPTHYSIPPTLKAYREE
jgi:hypothetical protein